MSHSLAGHPLALGFQCSLMGALLRSHSCTLTSKSAFLVREVPGGQVLVVVFSCGGRTAPQLTISTSSRAN